VTKTPTVSALDLRQEAARDGEGACHAGVVPGGLGLRK